MRAHSVKNTTVTVTKSQVFLAFFFTVFTLFALFVDGVSFSTTYFDGRNVTNVMALTYFSVLVYCSEVQLRKLMVVMVALSYIGELLFCEILHMYAYRTPHIPLYVPFGHAIVYASGYIFAHTTWAFQHAKYLEKTFAYGFGWLFLLVGLLLNDWFSVIFGLCFFLILKRKKGQNLYCFIALCVIFIELVGTYFQCWKWQSKVFGTIPASNPPMGAVFFYAGGDVLLAKITAYWESNS